MCLLGFFCSPVCACVRACEGLSTTYVIDTPLCASVICLSGHLLQADVLGMFVCDICLCWESMAVCVCVCATC